MIEDVQNSGRTGPKEIPITREESASRTSYRETQNLHWGCYRDKVIVHLHTHIFHTPFEKCIPYICLTQHCNGTHFQSMYLKIKYIKRYLWHGLSTPFIVETSKTLHVQFHVAVSQTIKDPSSAALIMCASPTKSRQVIVPWCSINVPCSTCLRRLYILKQQKGQVSIYRTGTCWQKYLMQYLIVSSALPETRQSFFTATQVMLPMWASYAYFGSIRISYQ